MSELNLEDILNESSDDDASSSDEKSDHSKDKKPSNSGQKQQASPEEGKQAQIKGGGKKDNQKAKVQQSDGKPPGQQEKNAQNQQKNTQQDPKKESEGAIGENKNEEVKQESISPDASPSNNDNSSYKIQKSDDSDIKFEDQDQVDDLNQDTMEYAADDLVRRKSKDDTELLGILDKVKKGMMGEIENKEQLRTIKRTISGGKSFAPKSTDGGDFITRQEETEQIFADNVKFNGESPDKLKSLNHSKKSSSDGGANSGSKKSSSRSSPREPAKEKKPAKEFNENDDISEDERKKILDELDLDSDDESSNSSGSSSESNADSKHSYDDSFQDKMNVSMYSEASELASYVDKENYLPFISDKYAFKNDVLEVIDRNERSFKIIAEKMIQKSSQLDVPLKQDEEGQDSAISAQRRLMHFKLYDKIAFSFHGQANVQQGVPYSIAALEDYIAIGSSDGSIRLYDSKDESQIKAIGVKEMKQNAVTCLDIKRVKGSQTMFLVAGHAKGQVCLYEVKGLPKFQTQQSKKRPLMHQINPISSPVSFKCLKQVSDVAEGQLVQVKFYGEFRTGQRYIQLVTCDINGLVYLSKFSENVLGYTCNKQCFWRKRLNGPAYAIAPLFYDFDKTNHQLENPYGIKNPYQNKSFIELQADIDGNGENRNHIIVFGALERIIACQVAPKPMELFCIERPDYIDAQIVPYLDWGEGLSPVYRDSTYPILAITWGRTVQLAVWTNHSDYGAAPDIKFDGFYICDGFSIDQCYFLDESLLFVLINKKEVRILYTQNFTPGVYDDKIFKKPHEHPGISDQMSQINNKKQFLKMKEKFTGLVSTYAEVDKGYRLLQKEEIRHKDVLSVSTSQLRSKFNFNPTINKNYDGVIVALGKSTVCQGKLLHWEEYLDLIRRQNPDDWLKVLRAALDIFNGKMVGLAGLPDHREAREFQLKERMKDLLRENIDACIQEFQEGQMVQSKTLRVATEFCIKVGAIDHLFGELFSMFAEAGIEQRYFENLEAFILSGKLKHCHIPDRILTRIIQYYRQKDVELLEKSILNLNLNKYPNNLEVRHICEEELLSSALIHMLLTIFDNDKNMENTVCLHILCALYSLMNKSKIEKSKEDVINLLTQQNRDSTILFEANQLREKTNDKETIERIQKEREMQQIQRQAKLEVEHSKTYIGYKLMWIIRLFLEGKKFPSGTMSSFKWRMYVFDIVRFITTPQFLKWLLRFDAQRFFKLILPLFLGEEPFQYIYTQQGFIEMYKSEVPGLEECASHQAILEILHKEMTGVLEAERSQNDQQLSPLGEIIENSYIFFISKVSQKGMVITINHELYCSTITKQLNFHRKLLEMHINIDSLVQAQKNQGIKTQNLTQAIANSKFLTKPEIEEARTDKDKSQMLYKHLIYKNEKDLLIMIKHIENSSDPMDEDLIKEFQKEADNCPLFMVRVYLHQILGNYQKCLTLFFRIKVIKTKVFGWLEDIQANILMHNDRNDNENSFKQIQDLILKNISYFIHMDPASTVRLTDQWFKGEYQLVVDAIEKYTDKSQANSLCFNFINTVIEMKKQTIVEEYMQTMVTGFSQNYGPSDKYKNLILKLVRILCEKKYRNRAMEYVQRDYFPIDECLQICEDQGVKDACAILYRRKGEYQRSVSLYVEVLTKLSKENIISALYVDANIRPFNDPQTKNQDIKRFDELMNMIIDICDTCGCKLLKTEEAEDLWLYSVENLYYIRTAVMESDEAQHDEGDLNNFQKFLMSRIQAFQMRMAEYVQLERIINFLEKIGLSNTYQEFQPTFEEKVKRETYHEKILLNASDLINKDIMADTNILNAHRIQGVVANQLKCDQCNMKFVTKWDSKPVEMFKCGHNFHSRCVAGNGYNCSRCFNEYKNIQNIIQSRQTSVKQGVGVRGQKRNASNRARPGSKSTTAGTDSDEEADKNTLDDSEGKIVDDYVVSSSPYGVDDDENSDYGKFEKKNQMFEHASMEKQMLFDQFL